MKTRLAVPPFYNMLDSIHAWIFPDIQPVPEITSDYSFIRVITIDGDTTPIVIRQMHSNEPLLIEFDDATVSKKEVVAKVRHILSLKLDLSAVHDIIKHDPILSNINPRIFGVRPYLSDTPFEALIKSVLQQQISYRAANVLTKRLILKTNIKKALGEFEAYHFPPPAAISSMTPAALRELGLGYKVDYVLNISKLVESGDLDLDSLRGRPYSEIRSVLLPIRGVGEWTVQAVAIAGLGVFSTFPYSDLGIRNLLGNLYNDGERMSTSEVVRFTDQWGEAGPLVLYLLMCSDVLNLIDASRHRTQKMHKST